MGRSRVLWALGTVTPWCLGAGLAVSFPAGAGHDAAIGGNIAGLTVTRTLAPADIVPPTSLPVIAPRGAFAATGVDGLIAPASLKTGNETEAFDPAPDEIEPQIVLKTHKFGFPRPDRSNKGDPFIGLRPTFDARLRSNGSLRQFIAHRQIFSGDVLAFEGFEQRKPAVALEEFGASPAGSAQASATTPGSVLANRGRAALVSHGVARHFDGASPAVLRAVALSSTTPVDAGASVKVVFARELMNNAGKDQNQQQDGKSNIARTIKKPNYSVMIARASEPAQRKCLAQAIYFEARSESEAGQAAVAQVVLNRVLSGLYPSSVCGVVFQNRHRYKACQFTFTCEGKSLAIRDHASWATAQRIAREVLEGRTYLAKVGGSTHYHATYVRPRWAKKLKRTDKIGTHVFYKLKPGQT